MGTRQLYVYVALKRETKTCMEGSAVSPKKNSVHIGGATKNDKQ